MKCSLVARLICRDSSAGIHLQGFIRRDSSESLQLALQYQALNGDSTGDSTVDSKITQSNWANKKKLQFNQEKNCERCWIGEGVDDVVLEALVALGDAARF